MIGNELTSVTEDSDDAVQPAIDRAYSRRGSWHAVRVSGMRQIYSKRAVAQSRSWVSYGLTRQVINHTRALCRVSYVINDPFLYCYHLWHLPRARDVHVARDLPYQASASRKTGCCEGADIVSSGRSPLGSS